MLKRSVEDHRNIVAALETRNPEQITDAMVRHMISVHETTKAAMEEKARER